MYNRLNEQFSEIFGQGGTLYASPHAVVLFGELAGVTGGYALGAAVNQYTAIVVKPNSNHNVRLLASDLGESAEVQPQEMPVKIWSRCVVGVYHILLGKGMVITGFDAVLGGFTNSQIPVTTQASLATLVAFSLNDVFKLGLSRFDLVSIAKNAVELASGQPCNLVYPFISLFGNAGEWIKFNTTTLVFETLPFLPETARFVILEPGNSHLSGDRFLEVYEKSCKLGFSKMREAQNALDEFRQITLGCLDAFAPQLSESEFVSCRFALLEQKCLTRACDALRNADLDALAIEMQQTQESFQALHQCGMEAMNYLVFAAAKGGLTGGRVLNYYAGGVVLMLISNDEKQRVLHQVVGSFRNEFEKELKINEINSVAGTHRIPL